MLRYSIYYKMISIYIHFVKLVQNEKLQKNLGICFQKLDD